MDVRLDQQHAQGLPGTFTCFEVLWTPSLLSLLLWNDALAPGHNQVWISGRDFRVRVPLGLETTRASHLLCPAFLGDQSAGGLPLALMVYADRLHDSL